MNVDEYVRARVAPEYQGIVARIRALMHELAPAARESMSYGMPTYKVKKIITYILPTKKDITFSFTYGAKFQDKYGFLKGSAKFARYLKFKTTAEIDEEVVRYYLRQALELDRRVKSPIQL
jgi:hypothetical protein